MIKDYIIKDDEKKQSNRKYYNFQKRAILQEIALNF